MKQAAVGAASATQAVKADKKPFFSQRTLSHFIDFLFVLACSDPVGLCLLTTPS